MSPLNPSRNRCASILRSNCWAFCGPPGTSRQRARYLPFGRLSIDATVHLLLGKRARHLREGHLNRLPKRAHYEVQLPGREVKGVLRERFRFAEEPYCVE